MQSTDRAFQLAFARLPPAAESQRRAHHISSLIIPFSHRYFLCLTGSQSYRPEVTKRTADLHCVWFRCFGYRLGGLLHGVA